MKGPSGNVFETSSCGSGFMNVETVSETESFWSTETFPGIKTDELLGLVTIASAVGK
jgi:hypothetical protein